MGFFLSFFFWGWRASLDAIVPEVRIVSAEIHLDKPYPNNIPANLFFHYLTALVFGCFIIQIEFLFNFLLKMVHC